MAAKLDLNKIMEEATGSPEILRGDSFGPIRLKYTGPSLVGAVATMTMRLNSPDGEVVQTLSSTANPTQITLDDNATDPIVVEVFEWAAAGLNHWDLELRWDSPKRVHTLYKDEAEITLDVTRD